MHCLRLRKTSTKDRGRPVWGSEAESQEMADNLEVIKITQKLVREMNMLKKGMKTKSSLF